MENKRGLKQGSKILKILRVGIILMALIFSMLLVYGQRSMSQEEGRGFGKINQLKKFKYIKKYTIE